MPPWVVWWDLDGTLLSAGAKAWVDPFGEALRSACRRENKIFRFPDSYSPAGKTDTQIIFELLTVLGFSRSRIRKELPLVKKEYLHRLRAVLAPKGSVAVKAGAKQAVEACARAKARQGVLTGNFRSGAEAKLQAAGFEDVFLLGAFGDGAFHRLEVAEKALKVLRRRGLARAVQVVVGDTPLDILCARKLGAVAVAVLGGGASRLELSQARPDFLLETLRDFDVEKIKTFFLKNEAWRKRYA